MNQKEIRKNMVRIIACILVYNIIIGKTTFQVYANEPQEEGAIIGKGMAYTGQDNTPDVDMLRISQKQMETGVKSNSEFIMTIVLDNTCEKSKICQGKLNLELPEGLFLDSSYEKETIDLPDIEAGRRHCAEIRLLAGSLSGNVRTLKVKARVSFQSETQSNQKLEKEEVFLLPVDCSENEKKPEEDRVNKSEENTKNNISDGNNGCENGYPVNVSEANGASGGSGGGKSGPDPMVPRVIISQYEYDRSTEAGKAFDVKLSICNTSEKLGVENMVVTVETGETASLEGSSNTVYIKKLGANETYASQIRLKVLGDGKADSASVSLEFKYEYLKDQERTAVESISKLSIPVQLPDRFGTGEMQTGDEAKQGEEFSLSLPYVNKGRTEVRNLEAKIKTDMKAGEVYKYIGNVEAGTSGSIDFFVTSEKAGKQKVHITLTYEDTAGNQKTIEKEGVFQIQKAGDRQVEDAEMTANLESGLEKNKEGLNTGMLAGIGGASLIMGSLLFVKIHKRKQSVEEGDEF